MNLLKIIFVSALFSFACTKNSEQTNKIEISSPISQNTNSELFDENAPLIIVEESGAWCGPCPSYKLSIFSDRTATFEENFFVEKEKPKEPKGKYILSKKQKTLKRKLTERDFKYLLGKFDEIDFFNLADKYIPTDNCPINMSDASTIHFTFLKNNKSKTIHYYRGCDGSEELKKLEDLQKSFDKIFDTDNWLNKGFLVADYEVVEEPSENIN